MLGDVTRHHWVMNDSLSFSLPVCMCLYIPILWLNNIKFIINAIEA